MTLIRTGLVLFPISFLLITQSCIDADRNGIDEAPIRKEWHNLLLKYPEPAGSRRLSLIRSYPRMSNSIHPPQLHEPANLLISREGLVYVSDIIDNALVVLDEDGNYAGNLGRYGQGPGEFCEPTYLSEGPAGDIFIFDSKNARIQSISRTGAQLSSFKVFKPCFSMAIDKEGELYLGLYDKDPKAPLLTVFDRFGRRLREIGAKLSAGDPAFNDIDIAVTDDVVNVVWKTFPLLRRYKRSGELLTETRFNHGPLAIFGNKNIGAERVGQTLRLRRIIWKMRSFFGRCYILITYPKLNILEFGHSGNIENVYWANTPFNYLAYDFAIEGEYERKRIYILQGYPDKNIAVFDME